MKLFGVIAVSCVLLSGGPTAGEMTREIPMARFDRESVMAEKLAASANRPGPNPTAGFIAGDNVESAIEIAAFPAVFTGTTCEFNHDYDAVCPFNNPGAPDVVYRYAPVKDERVRVLCCASSYDTKLYVFENVVGNVVACNDDNCGNDGFKSELLCVPLVAGNTYYFVLDGFFQSDCGEYVLEFRECDPCPGLVCRPGYQVEGEVTCADGYVDSFNAGCDTSPPAFGELYCLGQDPQYFCGTYGGYLNGTESMRDVDWYYVEAYSGGFLDLCLTGVYSTYFGVVQGTAGCPAPAPYASAVTDACEETCLNLPISAGTWWIFVTTTGYGPSAGECGGLYVGEFGSSAICLGPDAVTPATWGSVKARYR